MSPALVTVALCCFDAEDTIGRAVRSAIAQDWANIEILICDDASSDGSLEILRQLEKQDSRIKVLVNEVNLGAGGTRAKLVDAAKGEFICFFDDDDESCPERVAEQVENIISCERATGNMLVASYAGGKRHLADGRVFDAPAIGSKGLPPCGPKVAEALLINRRRPAWFYGSSVPTCSLMARKSTIVAVGNFDPDQRRLQDVEFAVRLALQGGCFTGTSRRLYSRYITPGPDKGPDIQLASWMSIIDRHQFYLKSIGRFEYAKQWHHIRYWKAKRRYDRVVMGVLTMLAWHPLVTAQHFATNLVARLQLTELR